MNQNLPESVLRLQLNTSFRSGRKILRLVDLIFNQPQIRPLVTGIEKTISHIAYKDVEGAIEIWPLVIENEIEETKPWNLPSDFSYNQNKTANQKLALSIANYINERVGRGDNPGDFLILMRRRTSIVNYLIKELLQLQVPVVGLDRLSLLEHPAILDLVALSNFLLCPQDDLNLAILLKSPLFNLSEEKLLKLCCDRETSLWEVLENKEVLEKLQLLSQNKSVFEFFFHILEYEGFRDKFIQQFSIEVNDVLDAFLDLIWQFETENISSLQLFLQFINTTKVEVKRDLSQSQQKVRIMTVHGAKGLQAPIVILTDSTSLPFNDDSIIWLNEGQLLWPGKVKYYPEIALEHKAEQIKQNYAEYLRLLYVALTRAENELIICGTSKKEIAAEKSWYAIVQSAVNEIM